MTETHDLALTPKLATALAKVQAQLPELDRDRTVEVETKKGDTYTYSYTTLDRLSKAVLPLLASHGLAFTALPGTGSDGKMCLRYHLLHESGERLSGEFPISGEGGIQMIGGRISYSRRYCLAAITGITADEDDESGLSDGPRPAQRAPQRARGQAQTGQQQQSGTTAQRSTPAARPALPGEQPDQATDPQLKKIATVFGSIGWTDRDDRLRAASAIVGRPMKSSKQLTKAEAHTLIEALEMVASQPDPAERLGELVASVKKAEG